LIPIGAKKGKPNSYCPAKINPLPQSDLILLTGRPGIAFQICTKEVIEVLSRHLSKFDEMPLWTQKELAGTSSEGFRFERRESAKSLGF